MNKQEKQLNKDTTKHMITQALKESRKGEGTLSLEDIAEILKEVLEPDELYVLIKKTWGKEPLKTLEKEMKL